MRRITTRTLPFLAVALVLAGCRHPVHAQTPDSGTTALQLSATPLLYPPAKVLVLPIYTQSGDEFQRKLATASLWLLLNHEGCTLVPLPDAFADWKADTLHEPGVPARIGDALRLGKAAGADWVVWGQVTAPERTGAAWDLDGELFFARTDTGQIFFLRRHLEHEAHVPVDLQYQGYALQRRLLFNWSAHATEMLISAFPTHQTQGREPTEDALRDLVATTWPDETRQ